MKRDPPARVVHVIEPAAEQERHYRYGEHQEVILHAPEYSRPAVEMGGMESLPWLHFACIVAALDVLAFLAGLATFIDRQLIEPERRWRFSLTAMMLMVTLVALNIFALIGLTHR